LSVKGRTWVRSEVAADLIYVPECLKSLPSNRWHSDFSPWFYTALLSLISSNLSRKPILSYFCTEPSFLVASKVASHVVTDLMHTQIPDLFLKLFTSLCRFQTQQRRCLLLRRGRCNFVGTAQHPQDGPIKCISSLFAPVIIQWQSPIAIIRKGPEVQAESTMLSSSNWVRERAPTSAV
jgi:hypothetical protein